MPAQPFLTAQWRHLAMVNYAVDPEVLLPYLPAGTEIDYFEGRTFVSLVGFLFLDTRLRGWSIPWHRNFEELNLRFYVRREVDGEVRRGVVFIKEIVSKVAVSTIARWAYGENYATHAMRHEVVEESALASARFQWRVRGRWNGIHVHGVGAKRPAAAGSEEQFIIEHYWGYTRQSDRKTLEYQVDHPPWHVWQQCQAEVDCDAASLYGPPLGEALAEPPSSALLADGSPVAVHRPQALKLADHDRRTGTSARPTIHDGQECPSYIR